MNESDLKQALQRELDELAGIRDELRVRIHLAKADAKDEWHKLEERFTRVSGELLRTAQNAKGPAEQMGSAARSMLDELRKSYDRLRSELMM